MNFVCQRDRKLVSLVILAKRQAVFNEHRLFGPLNKSSSTPTIVAGDTNEQYHPLVKTMAKADEVRLISESSMSIKDLKGFSKGGRVPTSASPSDVRYVVQLAKNDLDADLEEKFGSLRSAFGLKRKQLDVSEPDEGVGVITTPSFVYEVTISLDEQQPGKVLWRRCVVGLTDPQVFASDAFTEVFGGEFSILEVAVPGGLDVESIVDCVEEADPDTVKIDYDKDVTWCEIVLADSVAKARVTGDAIRVFSRGEITPAELIEAYAEVQTRFLQSLGLG